MRIQQYRRETSRGLGQLLAVLVVAVASLFLASPAALALVWDAQANTDSWFDPVNWNTNSNSNLLLPASTLDSTTVAEGDDDDYVGHDVSEGTVNYRPGQNATGAWDEDGEGVVYDPARDAAFFTAAASLSYPPNGYDRDTLWRVLLANNTAADATANGGPITGLAKLTIRGDMDFLNMPPLTSASTADTRVQIGRSSGVPNVAANALVVLDGGNYRNPFGDLEMGQIQTAIPGIGDGTQGAFGNGTFDYRSGTLESGLGINGTSTGTRVRLGAGGSSAVGGVGKFIMHNPGNGAGGHVRVNNIEVASFGGQNGFEPNGTTTGVGIAEFHYENGGTRAIQVDRNFVIANGRDLPQPTDLGIRSSRLKLVLDEAPIIDESGKPNDLALFDIDSEGNGTGSRIGPQAGANTLGLFFSDADMAAVDPLNLAAVLGNGAIVTAMYGASTYRWNIYYDGKISWQGPTDADGRNISLLDPAQGGGDGIEGSVGAGKDIVLIGLDSIIVPEGLAGDYNGDHVVSAADYTVWRNNLGASGEAVLANNGDGSGTVDDGDFDRWKLHFGESSGPGAGGLAASAVPEPGSILLTAVAMLGLLGIRRRNA